MTAEQKFSCVLVGMIALGWLTYRRKESPPVPPRVATNVSGLIQANPAPLPPRPETPTERKQRELREAKEQKQRDLQAAKDAEQARIDYAKLMEDVLLHEGFSVDVFTSGPKHTRLTFRYPLVSKATAYQFGEDPTKLHEMRGVGFTRFIMTDGYDTTYSWDLK